jgi:hypothetical protein
MIDLSSLRIRVPCDATFTLTIALTYLIFPCGFRLTTASSSYLVLTKLILNGVPGKLLYFHFHDTLILFGFETCFHDVLRFIFPENHVSAIFIISLFGNFMFLWQIFVMFFKQHRKTSILNLCVSVTSYGFACLKYLSFFGNL